MSVSTATEPSRLQFEFQTDRLSARQWRDSDATDIYRLYSNKSVVTYSDDGEPIAKAEVSRWLKVTDNNYTKYGYGMFLISHLGDHKFVGCGGIIHPGGQVDAEVKYALLPEFWGNGLATEFVQALIAYGQRRHNLSEFIATIDPRNGASRRVLEKSGFKKSEIRVDEDGTDTEVLLFAMQPQQN